jgi:hypothetical protein
LPDHDVTAVTAGQVPPDAAAAADVDDVPGDPADPVPPETVFDVVEHPAITAARTTRTITITVTSIFFTIPTPVPIQIRSQPDHRSDYRTLME